MSFRYIDKILVTTIVGAGLYIRSNKGRHIGLPLQPTITIILGLLILFLYSHQSLAITKITITDYQATFIPLYNKANNLNIAIRMYNANNIKSFLCVNPYTLQTTTLAANQAKYRGNSSGYLSMLDIKNTPYIKLLDQLISSSANKIENYGINAAKNTANGVYLTIDLCPSSRYFEKELFTNLTALTNKTHLPTPIAIAISGLWLLNHQEEFLELLKLQASKKIAITWINHSFSHPYYQDLPIQSNFLTTKPKYFIQEVLETEKILLEHGETPSAFFRFPGLISNQNLNQELKDLGLIARGSNAWLAKNQPVNNGAFILIHGNSNEPKGVVKFLILLKNYSLNFMPLNNGVISNIQ
jgi:peptidoglycan/xylan/chitin deacetylase (PgdA/CDA1 family)